MQLQPTADDTLTPATAAGHGAGPVAPRRSTVLRPLPFTATRLVGGFLARLQSENGGTSIPGGRSHIDELGAWDNFRAAASGRVGGPHNGPVFEDGEAFKWFESAAWELGRIGSEEVARWLAE